MCWPPIAVGICCVLAYLPALSNGFVALDDGVNFLENPHFRGVGMSQWEWSWSTTLLGVYQPLSWMLLGGEYVAFGLDPRGYHLASLALHLAVVLTLYAVLVEVLRRGCTTIPETAARTAAALSASFFAVHPLRVEAVAWASCQPYLPSAWATLLAVAAYLRAQPGGEEPPRLGWLAACLGMYIVALLFKAVAVGLPAALLALDVWPLRRLVARRRFGPVLLEKVPFFLVGFLFMAIAIHAKAETRALVGVSEFGASQRLAQSCYGSCFYLAKTAWPAGLTAYYPMPRRVSWADPNFWAPAAVVSAVTFAAVVFRRRWPGLLAGWSCYLAILAPNSGLVRIGRQLAADRYSYLASLPLVAMLAYALARLLAGRSRGVAVAVGVGCFGLVLIMVAWSWRLCLSWHDSETLWARALAGSARGDAIAHLNLGSVLIEAGRLDDAESLTHEAARLDPDLVDAPNNLGIIQARRGNFREALSWYAKALSLDPGFAPAHNNRGLALIHLGSLEDATREFSQAVSLDPQFAEAHTNLALALSKQGRLDEAVEHFRRSLRLKPLNPRARQGLTAAVFSRRSGP